MEKKPIKRSPHIVLLSREHHTGLLCCWKIRQGLKKQADTTRIQKYLTYFWDSHLQQHFGEEEEHLFDKVNDDFCRKALQQHQEIKALISQVQDSTPAPAPELLHQLADQLEAHIRYEERDLFPHLEQVLEEPELRRIGAALAQSHAAPAKDDFPDEFWVR
jgi:iron-sulfur cluster repair protein YtfE (RIC family)